MKLSSRYGEAWTLEPCSDGYLWKDIPEYTRFGFFPDNHGDICFIDPPGGPFLEVGGEITDGEVIIEILDLKESGVKLKTYKHKKRQ